MNQINYLQVLKPNYIIKYFFYIRNSGGCLPCSEYQHHANDLRLSTQDLFNESCSHLDGLSRRAHMWFRSSHLYMGVSWATSEQC